MVDNEKQAGTIFFDILEGESQQPAWLLFSPLLVLAKPLG